MFESSVTANNLLQRPISFLKAPVFNVRNLPVNKALPVTLNETQYESHLVFRSIESLVSTDWRHTFRSPVFPRQCEHTPV